MNILGIDSIIYGVEDVEACSRFFSDWGMIPARGSDGIQRFETQEKTTVEIRPHDDPGLPSLHHDSPFFEKSCGREVIWGTDTSETLKSIGNELGKDREVIEDNDGTLHCLDDAQNPVGFRITVRTPVTDVLPATNTAGNAARIDRQADGAIKGREGSVPQRLNHVVYMITGDVGTVAAFYLDRLGFKLSDKLGEGGYFMRAGLSHDHHNLLFEGRGNPWYGFQHAAFEYRDFDQIMHRGLYVEEQGWQSHIGPTRHTVGSNYSWYFWTPAGGLTELISDMDYLTDAWETRFIDPKEAGPPHAWYARPEQKELRFGIPHE